MQCIFAPQSCAVDDHTRARERASSTNALRPPFTHKPENVNATVRSIPQTYRGLTLSCMLPIPRKDTSFGLGDSHARDTMYFANGSRRAKLTSRGVITSGAGKPPVITVVGIAVAVALVLCLTFKPDLPYVGI